MEKAKIEEKVLLFLYVLSTFSDNININTFKRYLYLYYISSSFLFETSDNINIHISKTDFEIPYMSDILDDFVLNEFIDISENSIIVKEYLKEYVRPLLKNENGQFFYCYKQIVPFVNLLRSYNDQFIFTVFFSEPTFVEAGNRNLSQISTLSSKLSILLTKFKRKLSNKKIDEYDVLTYWMDFILKNYYNDSESEGSIHE